MEMLFQSNKNETYYRRHRYTEIPFDAGTKYAIGLIERDIYLLRDTQRWSCRIQTAGMSGAKVVISGTEADIAQIESAGDVSLNFSFIGYNSFLVPISLGIPYVIEGIEPVSTGDKGSYLVSLSNKHKPPDYLIGIFGDFIESTKKESKRKEQRIAVNENSRAALDLKSKRARFTADGKRHPCRVDDLSLSGAGITLFQPVDSGPEDSGPETGTLELVFLNPDMILQLPASVVKYQVSPGGGDTIDVGLNFVEDSIPHEFRERIRKALEKR